MPSLELLDVQDTTYQESVLTRATTKRLAIEAGSSFGWAKYVGSEGAMITADDFGASAPAERIFEALGFTVDNVVGTFKAL